MENIKQLIIFPDIHGRSFWKDVVTEYKDNPDYGFIFLGDYFDPYGFEGIGEDDAIANWKELDNELKDHPRTIWLLGNHDWHYMPELRRCYGCRRSYFNFDYISNIFKNELGTRFNIAYERIINGKRYIFSHAGITPGWAKSVQMFYTKRTVEKNVWQNTYSAEFINNELMLTPKNRWMLWMISSERGGEDLDGSCIWADVYEHIDNIGMHNVLNSISDMPIYQIFGHSYSYPDLDEYYMNEYFAMLDCKKPFMLNCETGELSVYDRQ